MRQSQEGRALRQFTLSTGKSAGRNSSGRITVFHLRLPILVIISIVIGLLVTLLSVLYASFFLLGLDENPLFFKVKSMLLGKGLYFLFNRHRRRRGIAKPIISPKPSGA